MSVDGEGKKELPELNQSVQDKRIEVEVLGELQGLFKDDESRINSDEEDVKDGRGRGWEVQAQGVPQGSAILWERFLHVRSIKVLLVENDDSTRHVVTALLRNCKYEVMEAANGLQAWKILEDLTNHVDLVLTEAVMPFLSGIGLLCKIMSHRTRKNIPVIMMSSHDSMGLVFNCLSKGAVDFLVKPIRKNELKNLWQHVWRRCHSSSGSGSESGTQTKKSEKSKGSKKSDNNSCSNDADNNGSAGFNVGDESDDGSGAQSSWTKQAVEVDSSHAMSPWDKIAECPDSTCAQVIRSNAETSGNKWLPMAATRESEDHKEQLDNVARGKELVTSKSRNLDSQHENPVEIPIKPKGTIQNSKPEMDSNTNSKRIDKGPGNPSVEYMPNKQKAVLANMSDSQMDRREFEAPKELGNILETNNKAINVSEDLPVIELSLKRLRGVRETGKMVQDECNVLRHSELSAFSRYSTTSNASKTPNRITGSSSVLDNDLAIVKTESYKLSTNPVVLKDKSEATSTTKDLHQSSAFKLLKSELRCTPQQVLVKADGKAATALLAPPSGSHQEFPAQPIHHHHHFHNMEQTQLLSDHDNISLKQLAADGPHCGPSNVPVGLIEGNPGNYSLNISASGSNHGSNGHNGSSTAVTAGGTNAESDIGLAGKSGSGGASGSGSGNRIDQDRFAQREAALTKFRQKRKERCFQKKVRYQNRKTLAEQRPRVRGQFIRQTGHEKANSSADS